MPATGPPQPNTACVYRGYVVVCSVTEKNLHVRQYAVDPVQPALFQLVGTSEHSLPRLTTAAVAIRGTTRVSCRPFGNALVLIVERSPAVESTSALTFRWSLDGRIVPGATSDVCGGSAVACAADCVAWYEAPTRSLRARTSTGRTYCANIPPATRLDDVVCGFRPQVADNVAVAAGVVVRIADRLVCLALMANADAVACGRGDALAVEAAVEKYEFECALQDIVVGSNSELVVTLSDGRASFASTAYGVSPRGHLLDLSRGISTGAPLPPTLLLLEPRMARSVCDVAKVGGDGRTHAILYTDRTVHVVGGGSIKVTYTSVQHFLVGDLLHRGFAVMLLIWNDAFESATASANYLLTDLYMVHKQRGVSSQCDTIKSKGHSMAVDALKARLQAAKRSETKLQSMELQLEKLISVFGRSRNNGLNSEPCVDLRDLIRQPASAETGATSTNPRSAALPLSVQSLDWFVHENLIIFAISCMSDVKPSVAIECDSIDELSHESRFMGPSPGLPAASPQKAWSTVIKALLPTFRAKTMDFRIVLFADSRAGGSSCTGKAAAVSCDVTVHALDLAKPERRLVTTDGASQRLPATLSQQRQTAWDFVQTRQYYTLLSDADLINRLLRFLGFIPDENWWTNGSACAFNGMRCRIALGFMEVYAKDQLQHSIFRQVIGHLATSQVKSLVIQSIDRSPRQLLESLTAAVSDLCSCIDEATQRALPTSHKRLQKPKRQPLQAASSNNRTKGGDATVNSSAVDCLRLVEALLIANAAMATSGADS